MTQNVTQRALGLVKQPVSLVQRARSCGHDVLELLPREPHLRGLDIAPFVDP